jgi:hypothetical protein
MRTILSLAPALLCAGAMVFCVRMAVGGRRSDSKTTHDVAGTAGKEGHGDG